MGRSVAPSVGHSGAGNAGVLGSSGSASSLGASALGGF